MLSGTHQVADLSIAGVALGPQLIDLGLDRPTARIGLVHAIDRLGWLAFASDRPLDGLGVLANERDADHGRTLPGPASGSQPFAHEVGSEGRQ